MFIHKPIIENHFTKHNNIFPKNTISTVLARQALFIYYNNIDVQNILVPRFLPEGVYAPLKQTNKTIHYYDYSQNFVINFDKVDLKGNNFAIHYIHPFGLYIKKNIDLLRHLKNSGIIIIDDRALTLPTSAYNEFANATLYSLYKSVGIPYGGIIKTEKEIFNTPTIENIDLKNKMLQNLNFYGHPNIKNYSSLKFRILNKIYGNSFDYSGIVTDMDLNNCDKLDENYIKKISQIDFDEISKKRIDIAIQYYDSLPNNFLWTNELKAFNTQSLIGFPIICKNPYYLYKKLLKKNIHSFILNKGWWFDKSPTNHLYNNHLLLPINYNFSMTDIKYIVNTLVSLV